MDARLGGHLQDRRRPVPPAWLRGAPRHPLQPPPLPRAQSGRLSHHPPPAPPCPRTPARSMRPCRIHPESPSLRPTGYRRKKMTRTLRRPPPGRRAGRSISWNGFPCSRAAARWRLEPPLTLLRGRHALVILGLSLAYALLFSRLVYVSLLEQHFDAAHLRYRYEGPVNFHSPANGSCWRCRLFIGWLGILGSVSFLLTRWRRRPGVRLRWPPPRRRRSGSTRPGCRLASTSSGRSARTRWVGCTAPLHRLLG